MNKLSNTVNPRTRSKAAGEPGKVVIRSMTSGRLTTAIPEQTSQQPEVAPELKARTNVNL